MESVAHRILTNVEKVIVGKKDQTKLVLTALLAGGHVLFEDVPGTGKTMLARSIARSINADFKRIQFTPDITPNDIVGFSIYSQEKQTLEFKPGPIMANIVLADEINRGTPRAQSATLEAMAERQVTIAEEGKTYRLSQDLFMVLATQNPIEHEGTYPLPEAQLDRFLMRVCLGYPSTEESVEMMRLHERGNPILKIEPVATVSEIVQEIIFVREKIYICDDVRKYIVDLVEKTRIHKQVVLGDSPRGCLDFQAAAKASAFLKGRDYVIPEDIKELAVPILAHRLVLKPGAYMKGIRKEDIIRDIVLSTEEPPYS